MALFIEEEKTKRPIFTPLVQGKTNTPFGGYISLAKIGDEFSQAELKSLQEELHQHLQSGNEEMEIELGITLGLLGQESEALQVLTKAEQKLPDNALAPYALARCLMDANPATAEDSTEQEGRWSVIVSHLREAVQLDPDNIPAHYHLGNAIRKLVEEESYVDVVEVYTKYLAQNAPLGYETEVQDFVNSQNPDKQREAAFSAGMAELEAGNYQKCIESFTKATELGKKEAFYHLGEAYEAIQNNEKAIDAYRVALTAGVKEKDAHIALGRMMVKLFSKLSALRENLLGLYSHQSEPSSAEDTAGANNTTIYQQGAAIFQLLNNRQLHQGAITAVAFSPDGQTVFTGSQDSTIQQWDRQGNVLRQFLGHAKGITSLAVSPDGKTILSGSADHTAKLWTLAGRELQAFVGHKREVSSVAFSPDGQSVLTGGRDAKARLWELSGETISTFGGHRTTINSVAFSPDGKMIITGSDDNSVKLWDLKGKKLMTLEGHRGGVNSVTFSPDGQLLVTGSGDGTLRLWDLDGREIRRFSGDHRRIGSVAFSPDGKTVLTGGDDKTAKLWDLNRNLLQVFAGHTGPVTSVAFSPDGQYILTGSRDKKAKLWTLSGELMVQFPLPALPNLQDSSNLANE